VVGPAANGGPYPCLDLAGPPRIVKKRDVLFPGQPDHDAEPVHRSRIQDAERRDGIGPDGIQAVRGHGGEVGGHDRIGGVLLPFWTGSERPVRDAPDKKLYTTSVYRFSTNGGSR